jgi:hypothetical protein
MEMDSAAQTEEAAKRSKPNSRKTEKLNSQETEWACHA